MKVVDSSNEFEQQVGNIADTVSQNAASNAYDPVLLAKMLFEIAEEKKSGNLMNHKIIEMLDRIEDRLTRLEQTVHEPPAVSVGLSDRDREVLDYVKENGMVSADDLAQSFGYKGKNAASARLSKLFHEGHLKKEYMGRKVLYKPA